MIFVKRLLSLVLLPLALVSLLPGCRLTPRSESDEVQVRLINAVPDAGSLTVSVDGQRVWKRAPFRSSTGYQGIAAGTYGVRVETEGSGGTLLTDRPLSFVKGHAYTVLALGRENSAATPAVVQVLEDGSAGRATGGKSGLRFINAAAGSGALDLVANNIVGVKSVGYGKRSDMLLLDSGSWDLKVVAADSPDSLAGPISLRLEPGHIYTLVAMGSATDQTLSLEAYPDGH